MNKIHETMICYERTFFPFRFLRYKSFLLSSLAQISVSLKYFNILFLFSHTVMAITMAGPVSMKCNPR